MEIPGTELAQATFPVATQIKTTQETSLLPGEIAGTLTSVLGVPQGSNIDLSTPSNQQAVWFVLRGSGTARSGDIESRLTERTLYAACPGQVAEMTALTDTVLLKIAMDLRVEDRKLLKDIYPLTRDYLTCEKYRDYFKSEKTISRTLVHPFTLPRFSMGSVETTGPDRIEPHAHPMLDQLFFSFAENSCSLIIDGKLIPFSANCLVHIPLGSDHGVEAVPGDRVHYLWVDFFDRHEDMQYLVDVHKPVEE